MCGCCARGKEGFFYQVGVNCIMCQGGFFSATFSSQVLFNLGLTLCINRMYLNPQNVYFLGIKKLLKRQTSVITYYHDITERKA